MRGFRRTKYQAALDIGRAVRIERAKNPPTAWKALEVRFGHSRQNLAHKLLLAEKHDGDTVQDFASLPSATSLASTG